MKNLDLRNYILRSKTLDDENGQSLVHGDTTTEAGEANREEEASDLNNDSGVEDGAFAERREKATEIIIAFDQKGKEGGTTSIELEGAAAVTKPFTVVVVTQGCGGTRGKSTSLVPSTATTEPALREVGDDGPLASGHRTSSLEAFGGGPWKLEGGGPWLLDGSAPSVSMIPSSSTQRKMEQFAGVLWVCKNEVKQGGC